MQMANVYFQCQEFLLESLVEVECVTEVEYHENFMPWIFSYNPVSLWNLLPHNKGGNSHLDILVEAVKHLLRLMGFMLKYASWYLLVLSFVNILHVTQNHMCFLDLGIVQNMCSHYAHSSCVFHVGFSLPSPLSPLRQLFCICLAPGPVP